ncbi:MAG: hypothetical protein WHT06_05595 [Desulfobacterales bacterium]
MAFRRLDQTGPAGRQSPERRSGLNRRWIKAPWDGPERRRGEDRRRGEPPPGEPEKTAFAPVGDPRQLEELAVSTALHLEALIRLLIQKGVLSPGELDEALARLRSEYKPLPYEKR